MPLNGVGNLALFVADSSSTSIAEFSEDVYSFTVAPSTPGVDIRATLSWIDLPGSTVAARQLIHDLDLTITSPDGNVYQMWGEAGADTTNVNERVIVPAEDAACGGVWTVTVTSNALVTTAGEQAYSLVVTGALTGCNE